jgi:hypothetical protein
VEDAPDHERHRTPQRGVPPARKDAGQPATEAAALVLLFGLVVSGQIRLRRLDGWRQIPAMLRARREAAA